MSESVRDLLDGAVTQWGEAMVWTADPMWREADGWKLLDEYPIDFSPNGHDLDGGDA